MPNPNDRVEDRSAMTGCGHVLFLTRGFVRVRFDDGSEEDVSPDAFEEQADGFWTI